MRKSLMFTLALLLSVAWLQAQQASPSSDNMSQMSDKTSNTTTVQGCLKVSGGRYSITDSSGVTHQLTGYANKLKDHVGHQVEITGTPTTRTASTTETGTASSAKQVPVIRVQSIKHIADTCSAT